MSMTEGEDFKSKWQLESNRRDFFERRVAELEGINDSLKLQNDVSQRRSPLTEAVSSDLDASP